MKAFLKEWAWQIIAILFFLLYIGKGCTSTKISKVNDKVVVLTNQVDSLKKVIIDLKNSSMTEHSTRDVMERVMLDYLIYEDDLDKGKTSLSDVKNKIEANDVDRKK